MLGMMIQEQKNSNYSRCSTENKGSVYKTVPLLIMVVIPEQAGITGLS